MDHMHSGGLLAGGDRRSIARSKQALALVRTTPARVSELASLAEDADWLVSMRALDLLEKIAHEHADWVQPYKKLFIGRLADSDKWEIQLQIARALPLLTWTPRERTRVVQILRRNVEHPQKFVRAWALDSLATFAEHDPGLVPIVERGLAEFERSGSKALQTRAPGASGVRHTIRRGPAPAVFNPRVRGFMDVLVSGSCRERRLDWFGAVSASPPRRRSRTDARHDDRDVFRGQADQRQSTNYTSGS